MKRTAMITAAAAAALALSGCSGSVDMGQLTSGVNDSLDEIGLERPDNTDCSGVLSLSGGAQAHCDLIYEDERNLGAEIDIRRHGSDGIAFDITIVDEDGNVVEESEYEEQES